MYLSRTLEYFFKKAALQFPAMLVTGARQVGKTTFLKHMMDQERTYVTLDDPILLSLAKEDPSLFMQRFRPPLLIDEIQYAPELLPYIKMEADKEQTASLFWLTGSQQFHLMKGISESLAGRVGIVQLLGLSRQECLGNSAFFGPFIPTPDEIKTRENKSSSLSLKDLYKTILRGSYPAIAVSEQKDRHIFYSSYVQSYLQRDIRDLAKVGDEMAFLRFLRVSASRTGQILNLAELARDADVSPNTAKNWISILQASGVIYLLEPYFSNTTKRLVKTPKLYFLDTGLCTYLTEWSTPETLEAEAMAGPILETWIMAELLKSWWHNGLRAPFYYYRDKDQKEIDLLIIKDGSIYPIEFKKTASPGKHSVRHFNVLQKLNMPVASGGVICLMEQPLPLTENIMSIPVGLI